MASGFQHVESGEQANESERSGLEKGEDMSR